MCGSPQPESMDSPKDQLRDNVGEGEQKASLLPQRHKTFIFIGISGPILFPAKNFPFPHRWLYPGHSLLSH